MKKHTMCLTWIAGLILTVAVKAQPQSEPEKQAVTVRTPSVFDQPELVRKYQETITPADLSAHLYFFASDFFEGRETATHGQKLAAHYLASQYWKMGLAPAGNKKDSTGLSAFFQPFTVYGRLLEKSDFEVRIQGNTVYRGTSTSDRVDPSVQLAFGNLPDLEGGVVFAGYGISDDELGYNDLDALKQAGIDVKGKWLLILPNEPLANDSTSLLPTPGHRPTDRWTINSGKLEAARPLGVKGLLVVSDAGPDVEGSWLGYARYVARGQTGIGHLSLEKFGSPPPIEPTYLITSDLADMLLRPAGKNVADLATTINKSLKPEVFELPGVSVVSRIDYRADNALETENVLALVEGSDPQLKQEVVVISSHYDHIGLNPGSGDPVNNGADDDGSGTVATLEIAEAFMRAAREGYRPRRSILFLNVSGEEKGLLGSTFYTDTDPVFPIKNTVANLNTDMIGRFDPTHPTGSKNYVYIIGSNLISTELHEINRKVNDITETRIDLDERFNSKDDPNRFYMRSDHWNFGKYGIPFIFYFTGTHEDYHQPGDEPQKIEYERMARITRLIFGTAWQLANQDRRPAVTGKGFN